MLARLHDQALHDHALLKQAWPETSGPLLGLAHRDLEDPDRHPHRPRKRPKISTLMFLLLANQVQSGSSLTRTVRIGCC